MEKVIVTDSISKTLFINIPAKAKENRLPAGILKDPFSEELITRLGYAFSKFDTPAMAAVGMVVRAQYFDAETLGFVRRNNDKDLVIVHVGAGLDTRFLRINGANQPAVFYELDLPDAITLREKVLPMADNEHGIKSSMLDTGWMDEKQIETWTPGIKHVKTQYLMKRHPKRWRFMIGRIMSHIPAIKNSIKLVTYQLG